MHGTGHGQCGHVTAGRNETLDATAEGDLGALAAVVIASPARIIKLTLLLAVALCPLRKGPAHLTVQSHAGSLLLDGFKGSLPGVIESRSDESSAHRAGTAAPTMRAMDHDWKSGGTTRGRRAQEISTPLSCNFQALRGRRHPVPAPKKDVILRVFHQMHATN